MTDDMVRYALGWGIVAWCLYQNGLAKPVWYLSSKTFRFANLALSFRRVLATGILCACAIFLLSVPIRGEFSSGSVRSSEGFLVDSTVVCVEDGVVVDQGRFVWCRGRTYDVPGPMLFTSRRAPFGTLQFGRVSYSLWVEVVDPIAFENALGSGESSVNSMHAHVKSLLYDFSNDSSHTASSFFNPLNDDQQRLFGGMVSQYMNPRLKEVGLKTMSGCRFFLT